MMTRHECNLHYDTVLKRLRVLYSQVNFLTAKLCEERGVNEITECLDMPTELLFVVHQHENKRARESLAALRNELLPMCEE